LDDDEPDDVTVPELAEASSNQAGTTVQEITHLIQGTD
jgi:hypothetical protein